MEMKEVVEMAKFLFEHKTTAHIDKKDKEYYNGLIIELHETFLLLNDRVLGETPITFSEIETIEKYKWGEIKWEDKK